MADLAAAREAGVALAAEAGGTFDDSAALLEAFLAGDSELPPVNAVLGGVLANELLKAVSRKGDPVNNFFFFCLSDGAGVVENICC
jgi:hypothetical protein